MKLSTHSFIIGTAVSICISCKQEKTPQNIIVPADISNSRDSVTISWYKEAIKTSILHNAGQRDVVTVLPVDHKSELWGEEIFRYDFSKGAYANEYAGLQSEEVEKKNFRDTVESASKQFEKRVNAAMRSRLNFNHGTDVFGALRQCEKYFLPGYENVVVLFSDMQQVTDNKSMNFERNLNTEKEIEGFLKSAEKIDLQNCKVLVLTGPQLEINSEKFRAIKKFWELYFSQNNGRLVDYSTGALTKLEQVLLEN